MGIWDSFATTTRWGIKVDLPNCWIFSFRLQIALTDSLSCTLTMGPSLVLMGRAETDFARFHCAPPWVPRRHSLSYMHHHDEQSENITQKCHPTQSQSILIFSLLSYSFCSILYFLTSHWKSLWKLTFGSVWNYRSFDKKSNCVFSLPLRWIHLVLNYR